MHVRVKYARRWGSFKVYVLPRTWRRAALRPVIDGVKLVDYGGFVDLVTEYNTNLPIGWL